MSTIATTKMSSKGQIVIPEEIRNRLGLKPGSQFVVVGDESTIVLKAISPPSMDDFDEVIAEARKQARQVSLRRSNIKAAIAHVRRNT